MDSLPHDPETLRAMLLAERARTVEVQAEIAALKAERLERDATFNVGEGAPLTIYTPGVRFKVGTHTPS